MNPTKSSLLGLVVCLVFAANPVRTSEPGFSLGIDKFKDLYMVDAATGSVHHFDSETGIYLGKFTDKDEIAARSITDISVCACGGAIALLDQAGNTVHVVDFEGKFLWRKTNSEPGMDFSDAVGIGICQDSNHEHVILTSKSGKVYHISPPNEQNKPFPITLTNPGGTYMDFYKQVFIADTGAKRVIKTDQWGGNAKGFGEGILSKPVDIATSEDKERKIWVCDQANARLHVFSKDFRHLFDAGEGYLTNPISVITDYIDSGAYVAEVVDGRPVIHKFDQNGAWMFTIKDALGVPVQSLLSASVGSYVLQNRNNRALNRRLANPPKSLEGKTYVELRPILESLGFKVSWDSTARTASVSNLDISVAISASGRIESNGSFLDQVKVFMSKGRMLIPLDLLEKAFDMSTNISGENIFFVSPRLLPWQMMPQSDLGKNLFETKCAKCHQAPVPDVRYRSDWPPIVQRMMAKNPGWISDKEADLIIRYLKGQAKPDKPD